MKYLLNIMFKAILLLGISGAAIAQYVDSFAPKHKLATQLAPALQEAFPQASIKAFSGQLIVSAPDEASFAQIRDFAAQLDSPTRSLRITVEQRAIAAQQSQSVDVNGQVVISNQGSGAKIGVAVDDTRSNRSATSQQTVTTLDGSCATIMLGQQRFIPQISFAYTPNYRIVQHGGAWQSAGTGFFVAPTVIGDTRVNVKLAPQSSRFNNDGSIELHSTYSEVEGRLGEWLPVGETRQEGSNDRRRLYGVDEGAQQTRFSVWLKVELQ